MRQNGPTLVAIALRRGDQRQQRGGRRHQGCQRRRYRAADNQRPGLHPRLRRFKGAPDIQRGTQGDHPKAFAFRIDGQVQLLGGEAGGPGHIDQRVFCIEGKNLRPGDAVGYVDIGRGAVHPNLLIAKNLADQVVTDVKTEDFHQVATDQSVVHQQLQVTVAVAEQGRHRVAAAAQLDVAIHLAEGFLHHLDVWHQRLQLQASRLQIGLTLQRLFITLQVYAAGNRPVGQAKAHRLQAQVTILQNHMGRQIADRQGAAVLNSPALKAHIGIHHLPLVGFKAVRRQHFTRRLRPVIRLARSAFLRPFAGIDAD